MNPAFGPGYGSGAGTYSSAACNCPENLEPTSGSVDTGGFFLGVGFRF
jgi:hypothetical protein